MYAAITAGGRVGGSFAEAIGTSVKALAPLGRGRLIDAAIAAAREAGVHGIAVVGGAEARAHCGRSVDLWIDEAPDGVENMRRALHAWPGRRLLYLTSDLPFVDGASLGDFMRRSQDAAIALPLAPASAYLNRFPGAPEHTMSLGSERFASGSVFAIDPHAVPQLERIAAPFFNARKSALRMALLLGPSLMARYALRTLRVEHIEARAQRLLGKPALAVRDASPLLCYDIDSLEDWTYAHGAVG